MLHAAIRKARLFSPPPLSHRNEIPAFPNSFDGDAEGQFLPDGRGLFHLLMSPTSYPLDLSMDVKSL